VQDDRVNHQLFVGVSACQSRENPFENAARGPSVKALIDDLPIGKALGYPSPKDAGFNRKRMARMNRQLFAALPPTWPRGPGEACAFQPSSKPTPSSRGLFRKLQYLHK
jgi:hypothetical protein